MLGHVGEEAATIFFLHEVADAGGVAETDVGKCYRDGDDAFFAIEESYRFASVAGGLSVVTIAPCCPAYSVAAPHSPVQLADCLKDCLRNVPCGRGTAKIRRVQGRVRGDLFQ